jgi:hypothetical protein
MALFGLGAMIAGGLLVLTGEAAFRYASSYASEPPWTLRAHQNAFEIAPPVATFPRPRTDLSEPVSTGQLTVVCFPACEHVVVGGRELGPSPLWQHELPAGPVDVSVRAGAVTKRCHVEVGANPVTVLKLVMANCGDHPKSVSEIDCRDERDVE